VDELKQTRTLAVALERENSALRERLAVASRTEAILNVLIETRRSETEALRKALAADQQAIAVKDAVIARQDALVTELKRRKTSPWKRVGDVLIGVAVGAILK